MADLSSRAFYFDSAWFACLYLIYLHAFNELINEMQNYQLA